MTVTDLPSAPWPLPDTYEGRESTTPTEAGPTSRLPHALADYRNAPSGLGPLAAEWKDKPHRLVYALAAEVTRLRIEAGCCGVCGRPPMRCVCPLTCPADCDCRGFA